MKRCGTLVLMVFAITVAPTISDAQNDPYKDDADKANMAAYMADRAAFLIGVENLYFAVGCKVFGSEVDILPVVNAMQRNLYSSAMSRRIMDGHILEKVKESAQAGLDGAAKPGTCKFWHDNPDKVASVRSLAASVSP